jgi:hypothetical protein
MDHAMTGEEQAKELLDVLFGKENEECDDMKGKKSA